MRVRLLATEAPGISRSEPLTPPADRLIGYNDATLEQHLLHKPKTQGKLKVEPTGMGDDLGWKPVALVADRIGHAAALKPQATD
jgi:hypothetical protein